MSAIAGAGAAYGLGRVVTGFAAAGDGAAKTARRLNMGVEGYQELAYWAERNGIAQNQMNQGLRQLSVRLGRAAAGENEKLAGLLERLGIGLRDAEGAARPVEAIMGDLAEAFALNEDPILRSRMATELFGEEMGVNFVDALSQGREAQRALRQEARDLGIVMSGEAATAAEALTDAQTNLAGAARGLGLVIGAKLAPVLTPMIEDLAAWIAANRELIGQRVSEVVGALAETLRGVDWGAVAERIGRIAGTVESVVEAIGGWDRAAVGLVALLNADLLVAIGAVAKALGALAVTLLANPIGLAVLAIAGGAYLIVRNWEGIGRWFGELWDSVRTIFRGFGNWLGGIFTGDFGRAADGVREMWSGIEDYYATLWNGVTSVFQGFATWIETTFGVDLSAAVAPIREAWAPIGRFFDDLMTRIADAFRRVWEVVGPIVEDLRLAVGKITEWTGRIGEALSDNAITRGAGAVADMADRLFGGDEADDALAAGAGQGADAAATGPRAAPGGPPDLVGRSVAAGVGAPGGGEVRVLNRVEIPNAPEGTRVTTETEGPGGQRERESFWPAGWF